MTPATGSLALPPASDGTPIRAILRVPLAAKLLGANLLVAVLAWGAAYTMSRTPAASWRVLMVVTAALVAGLVANLVLVVIALRPIRDLERTATRILRGDLDTRVPASPVADAELEQVGGTLNYLLAALARDRARVRALATEVVRTGDRERARLGRELHDSVAQSIAALRYQLIAIEHEASPELTAKVEALRGAAGEVLEQVRLLSHTVHPQILDDLGLVPALRHLARTARGDAVVSIELLSDPAVLRDVPPDAAAALYRMAQEAVTNALRHATAAHIVVRVERRGAEVVLEIADDGRGFDPAVVEGPGRALGLFTMRERIALAGGVCEVDSAPGRGTVVRARVPGVRVDRTSAPADIHFRGGS
jgi:two-component system, NarL family, sensor histidine kinase UhpB